MKKVYLAGPQVFLPNAEEWFAKATATCLAHGFEALVPLNVSLTTGKDIFEFNKKLLCHTDYVLADVTPFRGSEPDSGTAWEIGFAHALGKGIFAYSLNRMTVRQKAFLHFNLPVHDLREFLPDGMSVESFGNQTNLMLTESSKTLWEDFDKAIVKMAEQLTLQTSIR